VTASKCRQTPVDRFTTDYCHRNPFGASFANRSEEFRERPLVVLWRQLSNATPQVKRALAAYRKLDLSDGCPTPASRPARRTIHRLTASEINEAADAYCAGATLRELGAQFGVSRHAVARSLKAHGVRLRRTPMTPGEIEDAARFYTCGLPLARIANSLGYPAATIHLALRTAGVPMRDPHGSERER